MNPNRVDKMLGLRLTADRIPEVNDIKAGLDNIRIPQESGRAVAAAAQKERAGMEAVVLH